MFFQKGGEAASLFLAQQYVDEFGKLAKTNNTIIMPADVSNVNSMIVQVKFSFKSFMFLFHLKNKMLFLLSKKSTSYMLKLICGNDSINVFQAQFVQKRLMALIVQSLQQSLVAVGVVVWFLLLLLKAQKDEFHLQRQDVLLAMRIQILLKYFCTFSLVNK